MNKKDLEIEEKGQQMTIEDNSDTTEKEHTIGSDNKRKYTNTNSSKKNDLKVGVTKGDYLEFRMKRLLFHMGYYTKIGIILRTAQDSSADTITDLDVIGFYVNKDFKASSVWADCKSGKARPLERISWINGVKNISDINEVIFVKDGVRSSTRSFARQYDIRILETKMIEQLEKNYNVDFNDWRGSWNPHSQLNQIKILQKIKIPETDIYKRIGAFITCDYWTFDKYIKVKKSLTALKQLGQASEFPLKEEELCSIKWAIFEIITLFILALFEICRELYFFNEKDRKETIIEGLLSGEIPINKRNMIIEAINKTVHGIIRQHVPDFHGNIEIPNIGMNLPTYAASLYDLIIRITNEPLEYYDLLRMLDFMFMEYDLKNCDINNEEMLKLFPNYENMLISAKTILHFICNTTGIKKNIFGLFK